MSSVNLLGRIDRVHACSRKNRDEGSHCYIDRCTASTSAAAAAASDEPRGNKENTQRRTTDSSTCRTASGAGRAGRARDGAQTQEEETAVAYKGVFVWVDNLDGRWSFDFWWCLVEGQDRWDGSK